MIKVIVFGLFFIIFVSDLKLIIMTDNQIVEMISNGQRCFEMCRFSTTNQTLEHIFKFMDWINSRGFSVVNARILTDSESLEMIFTHNVISIEFELGVQKANPYITDEQRDKIIKYKPKT